MKEGIDTNAVVITIMILSMSLFLLSAAIARVNYDEIARAILDAIR